jgi:hypothetical protein
LALPSPILNVVGMRQRCELCEALGAVSPGGHKLLGVAVGPRDALLCADHALFALDSEVANVDELRELFEFVSAVEPSPDDAAIVERGRRRGSAPGHASRSIL